jgi:hypothetical protein
VQAQESRSRRTVATFVPPVSMAVAPNNRVGCHRVIRHGRRWADQAASHPRTPPARGPSRAPQPNAAPARGHITAAAPLTWLGAVQPAP